MRIMMSGLGDATDDEAVAEVFRRIDKNAGPLNISRERRLGW